MKKAIAARKDYAAAWFSLGQSLPRRGRLRQRRPGLPEATSSCSPRTAPGHANLGALYIRMKRIDEGIKELETALSLQARRLRSAGHAGHGVPPKGRLSEGHRHLRKATELKPDGSARLVESRRRAVQDVGQGWRRQGIQESHRPRPQKRPDPFQLGGGLPPAEARRRRHSANIKRRSSTTPC